MGRICVLLNLLDDLIQYQMIIAERKRWRNDEMYAFFYTFATK